jgi:hypothetical protein
MIEEDPKLESIVGSAAGPPVSQDSPSSPTDTKEDEKEPDTAQHKESDEPKPYLVEREIGVYTLYSEHDSWKHHLRSA